jgi:hypothetical protein
MRPRLLRTALGRLAAALSLAACASDGAMGPGLLTAAAPAPVQLGLAGAPWEIKESYVLAGGVKHPATIRYRSWAPYPGYAGTPVSVEYEITSTLGAALLCGETGFFAASIVTVPCAGTVERQVPDFVSYAIQDLGDQVYELYPTAGGYNHTGARALTGHPYLPYRVVDATPPRRPRRRRRRRSRRRAAPRRAPGASTSRCSRRAT